jgi:hypothetical protein
VARSLAEWLALAPQALPVCSQVAAMIFGRDTRRHLERLAQFEPRLLACMHGSSFAGDGRAALLGLAAALEA